MQPDIEIYLLRPELEHIECFLTHYFDQVTPVAKSGISKGGQAFVVRHQNQDIEVLYLPKVAGNFASLWLDSPNTPWQDDLSCARDAFALLDIEVRCNAGGWQEDADPDAFIKINAKGEKPFLWQD